RSPAPAAPRPYPTRRSSDLVTVAVTRFAVATCEVLNAPLLAAQFTVSPATTVANEQLMLASGSVVLPLYVLLLAVRVAVNGAVVMCAVAVALVRLVEDTAELRA